jgi:hypothetical protein
MRYRIKEVVGVIAFFSCAASLIFTRLTLALKFFFGVF